MKYLIISFILMSGFTGWSNNKVMVTSDVTSLYMPNDHIEGAHQEIKFWNAKVENDLDNAAYRLKLAAAHENRFALTGNIEDLRQAESLIQSALEHEVLDKAPAYRMLAHNFVSQHRFCDALDALLEASVWGSDFRETELMLFDVYLELGHLRQARESIARLSVEQDFHYLIRKAKLEDKDGRLPDAIASLEQALHLAENSRNPEYMNWAYSNIGDFYGHAGKLDKSRDFYIRSLKVNSADWYALKGLAWMAYSHDENPDRALAMLQLANKYNASPSIDMLASEILAYKGEEEKSEEYRNEIFRDVSRPLYGHMYHDFINQYYIDNGMLGKARMVAKHELDQRETPEAYVLMVRTLSALGMNGEARSTAETHIVGRTWEPALLLEVLPSLDAESPQFRDISDELKECRYELGPYVFNEVEKLTG